MAISKTSAVFRKCGDTLDHTPAADVAAGALIVVGGIVGLATHPIAGGTTGALKALKRGEVVEVTTDEAIGETAAGTAIYVTSAGLVTKTAADATLVGYARAAVGASDTTFEIVCA